jgi:hypothetical protein
MALRGFLKIDKTEVDALRVCRKYGFLFIRGR